MHPFHKFYADVPQSPFDVAYGTSLLPQQLLVGTPYASPVPSPLYRRGRAHPGQYAPYAGYAGGYGGGYASHTPQQALTDRRGPRRGRDETPLKFKSKSLSSMSSLESTFDVLSLSQSPSAQSPSLEPASRTPTRRILLAGIDPQLTLTGFLDHVRFGPLESARMVEHRGAHAVLLTFFKTETCLAFYNSLLTYLAKFKLLVHAPDLAISFVRCKRLLAFIASAVNNDGATRNVYIGNLSSLERHISVEFLSDELTKFGIIDKIDLIVKGEGEKKDQFAFVHFASVASAIKAVEQLSLHEQWEQCKIFYGTDRCSVQNDKFAHSITDELVEEDEEESYFDDNFRNENMDSPHMLLYPRYPQFAEEDIAHALQQKSATAAAVASTAGGVDNIGNRTVCISNLDPDSKVGDICNVIRGGLIHMIKFLDRKRMCFVTFVDAEAAAQFFANASIHPIVLHSRRLKIGWGHHSGPLPNSIALSVTAGASRNVYIGVKDGEEGTLPDEEQLRHDFTKFGEIEQINFIRDNRAAFLNFLNISHAMKVVEDAHGTNQYQFHEYFDNRYRDLKINFGKDRCGNSPKPKKKKSRKRREQPQEEQDSDAQQQQFEEVPAGLFASMGISQPSTEQNLSLGKENEETSYTSSASSQLEIITTQPYTPSGKQPHSRSRSQSFTPRVSSNSSFTSMCYPDERVSYRKGFTTTGSQVMAQYLAQTQHANMVYAANVLNMPDEEEYRRRRY